jgi:hypothetical protein
MADEQAKKDHEQRMEAVREANAESEKRMSTTPTPSQEENDLAAIGELHPDEKKSHEQPDQKPAPSRAAPAPSSTRASSADTTSSSATSRTTSGSSA